MYHLYGDDSEEYAFLFFLMDQHELTLSRVKKNLEWHENVYSSNRIKCNNSKTKLLVWKNELLFLKLSEKNIYCCKRARKESRILYYD